MRVLEARFHPHKRNGKAAIVVGRVYVYGTTALVQGATGPSVVPITFRDAMIEKLRYLVRSCGNHPYDGLTKLRSDFWSFVELIQKEEGERP